MRSHVTVTVDRGAGSTALLAGLLAIAVIGIAFGIVRMPWLVAGAVLGVAVLVVALTAPLALVALMLVIGPIDLSFITGGFKSLFPGLGGLDMNGIRLVGATMGFIGYIMFEPRSRSAAAGPLGRWWLVFLAYAGATIAVSLDPLEGMRLLLKLAYPFLTFLIVIGVANSRQRLETLTRYTLLAAALYTIIVNPLLALNGGYRMDAEGLVRVGGLGSGDNPFAFYLMIMLLIAFTRFIMRGQVVYLAFCGLLVLWIALTVTRIAMLGSVIGLSVVGLVAAFTSQNKKVLLATGLTVAVVTVALLPNVLLRSFGFVPTPAELIALLRDPVALFGSINWQGRQLLWAILWTAIMAAPLLGSGLGSSAAVIRETFPDQSVLVAHNEYLRLATDVGLVGTLLFAGATAAWLITALRLSVRGDRSVREFALPAVGGMIAWVVVALTDNPIDYYSLFTQYIGFLVAGAVVAQVHAERETESGTP